MCIRDGVPATPSLDDRKQNLLLHADVAKQSGAELIVRLVICLLYTSDAADERSSVDLGGRRIIKKKKIEEE